MTENSPNPQAMPEIPDLSKIGQLTDSLRLEIQKVVYGQSDTVNQIIAALLAGGHVLLEGKPGLGKTHMVLALASTFGGEFGRLQFTPDMMPSDITGFTLFDMKSQSFQTRRGPVFTNLLLADEINRTSPKTQASLLEAMEEQQVTVDGITYALPELFMVIATQNPVEQLGTYRLPEAQLDRFMMKISMGYPETPADEADIVRRMVDGEPLKKLSPVTTRDELMQIKEEVKAVAVHQDVMAYAVEITRNTRKSRYLSLGASPRAAIALVRAAKSRAYLEGRTYTTPEDIAALAPPVLLHRLILSSEARLEGKNEREMLQEAMRAAHVPVL